MSKYSIAKDLIAAARAKAKEEGHDAGDVIEALIITAIGESVSLRGKAATRQSLVYEMQNIGDEIDYDFVRSR